MDAFKKIEKAPRPSVGRNDSNDEANLLNNADELKFSTPENAIQITGLSLKGSDLTYYNVKTA
jgi:hypothetical protein